MGKVLMAAHTVKAVQFEMEWECWILKETPSLRFAHPLDVSEPHMPGNQFRREARGLNSLPTTGQDRLRNLSSLRVVAVEPNAIGEGQRVRLPHVVE